MSGRESLFSLAHLSELHAAQKNTFGEPMVYASRPQMEEFYAMHQAFPALKELAEAAASVIQCTEDEDGYRWISLLPGGQQRLWKALCAFEEFQDRV